MTCDEVRELLAGYALAALDADELAVVDAHVNRSVPPQVFDQAALESFRKWRFTPMLDDNGQPSPVSGRTFTLAFRLGR